MKNIALTGHTSGIGLALFRFFQEEGYNVCGYSRSNGFSLKNKASTIARLSADADLFINNAHYEFKQVSVLQRLAKIWWDDPRKMIICISSIDGACPRSHLDAYSLQKKSLNEEILRIQNSDARFKLVNIILGLTDTPLTSDRNGKKISVSQVVSAVKYIIQISSNENILIDTMTLRPI